MSIVLDSELGLLSLRIWRLQIEYRRFVRMHHDRKMPNWTWRWL